jgi:two-component system, NtrC family, response regulator HydG
MARLLLVEDDVTFSKILLSYLTKKGHSVEPVYNLKGASTLLEKNNFDLLLLDYRLPDGNGIELLIELRKKDNNTPAIMMTSFNDVRTAVKAMRLGAFDYITKPINQDEFLMVLNQALIKTDKNSGAAPTINLPEFVKGESHLSKKLHEQIVLIAPTAMSVIIEGESGTGKENVARSIHGKSKRGEKPFIAIDCGALSTELAASELFGHVKGAFTGALQDKKGKFELAKGGTILLDEIGNLNYDIQVKLLRALQEKIIQPVGSNKEINIDIRIIAATNEELIKSVQKGDFREDLFHRLNEFKITVPPLRERKEDLSLFVSHFIKESNLQLDKDIKGISPEAMSIFENYDWPGNLRELKNVVKRMVLLSKGELAVKESLPEEMLHAIGPVASHPETPDLKVRQELTEKELIRKVLEEVKFNKTKAAKILNIDRSTLYVKMKKYGFD